MDMQDHAIFRVWIHSLYPKREKSFGLSWNRTQVLLHHKQPLWPLDHGSLGTLGLHNLEDVIFVLFLCFVLELWF